jgi:hypothetical protein
VPGFQFNANEVSGRVFKDKNRNGRHDRGERGLAGRTVFLDANGNGRLDRRERWTTTDAEGRYVLAGVATGKYTVRVVARGSRAPAHKKAGKEVKVKRDSLITGVDFGLA